MDPCDLVEQWDSLSPSERLQALDLLVNDHLAEHGYSAVTVSSDDLTGANADYGSDVVRFDADYVMNGEVDSMLATAYHEAAHAMRDQDGGEEMLTEEEEASFNELGMVGFYDDDGELGLEEQYNPFHQDVFDYAEAATAEALDRCQSEETPAESASSDDDVEIEWGEPIITDEPPPVEVPAGFSAGEA